MIVCPACHAENPDGTKICVKCGTELPKPAVPGKAKAAAAAPAGKSFGLRDIGRDMVDMLWLLLIIILICTGFWWTATNGTWHLTDTEEAKIMEVPVVVAKKPAPRPSSRAHRELSTEATAEEGLSEVPAVPSGSASKYFEKSKEQFDGKHYQTSFNYLRQALEIDPTYAKAYFGLGYLYARFDMDDAAVRMYEMALRFDPDQVESVNNLAMMYFRAGNYDDSVALFQKAVALNGQNEDYAYNLGRAYLEKDQYSEALQAYKSAAALKGNDDRVYNDMALIFERTGKKSEAQDAWQKVMQYSSNPILIQQAKTHLDFLQTQS